MKNPFTLFLFLVAGASITGGVLAQEFSEVRRHDANFTGATRYANVSILGDLNSDGHDEYGLADIDSSTLFEVRDGKNGQLLFSILGSAMHFGASACSHPDVNGDGIPEFAVGESESDVGGGNSGRVLVYSGYDGSLIRTIFGPPTQASDQGFGWILSSIQDINNDGFFEILVSSMKGGTTGHYAGSVTAVDGATGVHLWTTNGIGAYDYFAKQAVDGPDMDSDGIKEIAIGAYESSANSGDGYVQVLSGATGTPVTTINGWGSQLDNFGDGLAWTADFDSDGFSDLIIAASGEDTYGNNAGRVGVFSSTTGNLLHEILPPLSIGVDSFWGSTWGGSFLSLPDSDGDGVNEVLIPAQSASTTSGGSSAACFLISPSTGNVIASIFDPDGSSSRIGRTQALIGDVESNGGVQLALGTSYSDKAFVFEYTPGTLSIGPIYENGEATFYVNSMAPKSWLFLCWSFTGSGPTPIGSCGLSLDLSEPIRNLDPFELDSDGSGQLGPFAVPPFITAGTEVWFQGLAFDPYGVNQMELTNMVNVTVQ
ncbi:MAG: hypothetical protein QGH51_10110 [Planctomycetota bacterium]|nr:hypothetical protein [Planctomycetota bacterium]